MRKHRVLIVDDTKAFSSALAGFWRREPDIEVAGVASSGLEALHLVRASPPDVILMDVDMPEMNGLDALQLLKAQPDCPPVVLMTFHDVDEYAESALARGADKVVSKSSAHTELLPVIRALSGRKSG